MPVDDYESPMYINVATGGAGSLIDVIVKPYLSANQHARATAVKLLSSGGTEKLWTNAHLRTRHLLNLDDTGNHIARAAVKDEFDVWSEAADSSTFSASNFSAGSTEASIASGSTEIELLEEPGLSFPDLSHGSGQIRVQRTIVSDGFYDEMRRIKSDKSRMAVRVRLSNIDELQADLLHEFFSQLRGPHTPFIFEWISPVDSQPTRIVARFRDPDLVDELARVDRYDMEFSLIELTGIGLGTDV